MVVPDGEEITDYRSTGSVGFLGLLHPDFGLSVKIGHHEGRL